MSVPLFHSGPVLIASAIALAACIHVARNVYKSGVEHRGTHILLLSAVINTALVSLMLLLFAVVGLAEMARSGGFDVPTLVVSLALLLFPLRMLWNYATMVERVERRFRIEPYKGSSGQWELVQMAQAVGVPAPTAVSSPLHRTPCVYGRRSKSARMVVPVKWATDAIPGRRVMLAHELAHIRNRDVGFLTWAFAFLRDLKWLLLSAPAVVILSQFTEHHYLTQAALLYVACLSILWILTGVVLRQRELLADSTVALYMDSGAVAETIDEVLMAPSRGLWHSAAGSAGIVHRIRYWLTDKALFSRRTAPWKVILWLVDAAVSTHPSAQVRLRAIRDQRTSSEHPSVRRREAFWAGVTLGFLGAFIALGGFWIGKFLLRWQDDKQVCRLSYNWLGAVVPLVVGLVALFFVLPAWSSIRVNVPTRRNLLGLASRYMYGLLGACCVSPLILLGDWSYIEIKVLSVLQVLWIGVILGLGLCVNLVMWSLWLDLRYQQREFFTDLAWTLYACGLGILGILAYLALGLVLLFDGRVLEGSSIVFGLLMVLPVYSLIIKDSHCSGTDQYMVIAAPLPLIRMEGAVYKRWSWLAGSVHMVVLGLVPAAIVSAAACRLGHVALAHLENPIVILVFGPLGCATLLILARRWPRRMRGDCRRKAAALSESLRYLGRDASSSTEALMDRLIPKVRDRVCTYDPNWSMTTAEMSELARLALPGRPFASEVWHRASEWAMGCETRGGFGPWPRSTPRLSTTYRCLEILQKANQASPHYSHEHTSWILSFRTPDGSFQGPWSKRPRWEDTFFAVASVDHLGADLDGQIRAGSLRWARTTLSGEGIEKEDLSAVVYCLATLQTFHALDEEIVSTVGRWLSVEVERLLLTNIAHNAENVHHAARAYHILRERGVTPLTAEQIDLLADRINAALEAELAALRI